MEPQNGNVDRLIARLAGAAHGVVTNAELRDAGVGVGQIRQRRESGRLIAVFRGVYRAGHIAWSPEAWYMAAVKAAGEGAVLSGLAAAWAWGLVRGRAPRPEVTGPRERKLKGVRTRVSRRLDERETTTWRGIPITTVPRTLVDLPSLLSFDDLTKAVHEADVRHDVTAVQIEAALRGYPNAPGAASLRAIATGDEPTLLSELEKRFLALLRAHRLPLPQTNRQKGAGYIDCRWPAHNLTVELDSYRYHRTRQSWEKDLQRARDARARGDEFRRYSWKDLVEHPEPTVDDLRNLLGA